MFTTRITTVAVLLVTLAADAVSGQSVEEVAQLESMRQHARARALLKQLIADKTEEQIRAIGFRPPLSRYSDLRETCFERIVELKGRDTASLLSLAVAKAGAGKLEAAETLLAPLRNSNEPGVQKAFQKAADEMIEKMEAADWKGMTHFKLRSTGLYRMLSGKYELALKDFRGINRFPVKAWTIWCEARLDPSRELTEQTEEPRADLTVATLLSERGQTAEALMSVRAAVRKCEPFLVEDYASCQKLLEGISANAVAARVEYETMLKIHQVAAGMAAFQQEHRIFPAVVEKGRSWRQQIASYLKADDATGRIPELFSINGDSSKTPFVVVVGPDTVFPPDAPAALPGRQIIDGTSNTLMILASPERVVWKSTVDLRIDELNQWKTRVDDGVYTAACDGNVYWFSTNSIDKYFTDYINCRDGNSFGFTRNRPQYR